MNVFNLVKALRQSGAHLSLQSADGSDSIKLRATPEQVTSEQMAALKAHKAQVIDYLRQEQALTENNKALQTLTPSDFPLAEVSAEQLSQYQQHHSLVDLYMATPMQAGMIFHGLNAEQTGTYINQLWMNLNPDLELETLRLAWQQLTEQHAVFRTCFVGFEAQLLQLVCDKVEVPWQQIDLRDKANDSANIDNANIDEEHFTLEQAAFENWLEQDRAINFNFEQSPLFRLTLITTSSGNKLVWTYHHVLVDGWCSNLVLQGVMANYQQLKAGAKCQVPDVNYYKQYIQWLAGQDKDATGQYWQDLLAPVENVSSVSDLSANMGGSRAEANTQISYGNMNTRLSQVQTEQLSHWARENNLTLNTLIMGAWAFVCSIYANQKQVCFGATVSGRPADLPNVNQTIGLFINSIPMQVLVDSNKDVIGYLTQIQNQLATSNEHSHFPLNQIQKLTSIDGPLFESLVVFENYYVASQSNTNQGDLSTSSEPISDVNHFNQTSLPLTLVVSPAQTLEIAISYQQQSFSAERIDELLAHMQLFLTAITELKPSSPLADLPWLTAKQQIWLDEHTVTDLSCFEAHSDICLHQLFAQQVIEHPNKTALVSELAGEPIAMSYAQLDTQANALAGYLIGQQKTPGALTGGVIGLCFDRQAELLVAMLAVLKVGAAYLSIDPQTPITRREYIIEDSGLSLVLTTSEHQWLFTDNCLAITLDTLQDSVEFDQDEALALYQNTQIEVDSSNLAYMIYTSGSTGKPKGVMIPHQNVVALLDGSTKPTVAGPNAHKQALFDFNSDDVWTLFHSTAFDFSVWEIWGALAFGGKLVVVPSEVAKDAERFYELLVSEKVTILNQTPSAFYVLSDYVVQQQSQDKLRTVIFGGEALDVAKLQPWLNKRKALGFDASQFQFVNMYGITETTVHVTYEAISEQQVYQGVNTIGKALPHLQVRLLGANGQMVPCGVMGEMYVGGLGLAKGYWNNSELTAERFVTTPTARRNYRTGDLAMWLDDGRLVYKGRADHQVKIRGHRIELGEVEAALKQLTLVKDAYVLTNVLGTGHQQLIAYVVASSSDVQVKDLPAQIKQELAKWLPDYMVPAHVIEVAEFTLTINGKVDTKALPQVRDAILSDAMSNAQSGKLQLAQTEIEQTLSDIWCEVLNLSQVDIDANFFALGGDSILSINVAAKAKLKGLSLAVPQIFNHPTVRALALSVDKATKEQGVTKVTGDYQLLPIQQRFLSQNPNHYNRFNHALLLKLPNAFDSEKLSQIGQYLAKRHDALSTRFNKATSKGWIGSIKAQANSDSIVVHCEDLSAGLSEYEQREKLAAICEQYQGSLDITKGQLFKLVWFKLSQNTEASNCDNRLLIIAHHLIIDGISWRVLLSEIESVAKDLLINPNALSHRQNELAQEQLGIADWSVYLTEKLAKGEFNDDIDFWQSIVDTPTAAIKDDLTVDGTGNNNAQSKAIATVADEAKIQVQLPQEVTSELIGSANSAFYTQVNELLLASVYLGLKAFTNNDKFTLLMEGHGREHFEDAPDINQALGWFTSLYPWVLTAEGDDVAQVIAQVKDSYRQIPHKGLSYGLLGELGGQHWNIDDKDLVVFNYLGQFDQVINQDSLFTPASEDMGALVDANIKRGHKLGINALVTQGCLHINLDYNTTEFHQQSIEKLGELLVSSFTQVAKVCKEIKQPVHTVSDFPQANLSQSQLLQLNVGPHVVDIYPATGMQQGLLFFTDTDNSAYTTQVQLDFAEQIDGELFKQAWLGVIARHDIFRTRFSRLDDGRLMQVVDENASLPWSEQRLEQLSDEQITAHIDQFRIDDKQQGFSLGDHDLMRVKLWHKYSTSGQCKTTVLWSHHHSLLDGWSVPLVFNEVINAYSQIKNNQASLELPPVTQFKHFVHWLEHCDTKATQNYWREYLQGFTSISQLPESGYFKHRSGTDMRQIQFTKAQTEQLHHAVKHHQTTLNILVQGAWALLLSRYNGDESIVFGTPVSGRPATINGIDQMIGMFINTIAIRVDVSRAQSIGHWLKDLYQAQQQREAHDYFPLKDIQLCSEVSGGSALFDSILVFQNYPVDQTLHQQAQDCGLALEQIRLFERSDYGLVTTVAMTDILNIKIQYQCSRFSDEKVLQLLGHFKQLLLGLCELATNTLGEVALFDDGEYQLLTETFNQHRVQYDNSLCIHELIEQQAEQNPEGIAVSSGELDLTYTELNERANQIAHYLLSVGVVKDQPVGLCLRRSEHTVIGILAILKAGGAYVPIDVNQSVERIGFIIEDADIKVMLTHSGLMADLPTENLKVLPLDYAPMLLAKQNNQNIPKVEIDLRPENLAYVLYTSGSTGQPKGVMVEHRNVVNLACASNSICYTSNQSHVVQYASLTFDASVVEWVMALTAGARFIICDDALKKSPQLMEQFLLDNQITHGVLPPALVNHMDCDLPYKLQMLAVGGEAIDLNLSQRWSAKVRLVNFYGPTEATVICATKDLQPDEIVTIGTQVANTQLYVTNSLGELLPQGVVGELCIGGDAVARGYLNRDDLNATQFIDNPFNPDSPHWLYKTGDLVRFLANGELECLGRMDSQVKIRGHRIELGEIESFLTGLEQISASVVMSHARDGAHQQLVAYYEPVDKQNADDANFRQWLREQVSAQLPAYMVPAVFIGVESFTMTLRGKVDRDALPLPSTNQNDDEKYVAPRNELEQVLCEIWQDVLKVDQIGIDDNFFSLGGDSILAILVVSRANAKQLVLNVNQLFDHPSIAQLATVVYFSDSDVHQVEDAQGYYDLLPIQQRFFAIENSDYSHFNHSLLFNTPQGFDQSLLRAITTALVNRHDSLRLTFVKNDQQQFQGFYRHIQQLDFAQFSEVIDLAHLDDAAASEQITIQSATQQNSLDLTEGPIFKMVWFDLGPSRAGRLLIIAHHLVVDGVSWRVLLQDCESVYQQRLNACMADKSSSCAAGAELGAKTESMQTWSNYLTQQLEKGQIAQSREYWLQVVNTETDSLPKALPAGADNSLSSVKYHQQTFEQQLSADLIGASNQGYNTQVNELLLTALYLALKQFTGGNVFDVCMEGHGREQFSANGATGLDASPDLSQTVGWFTSLYPKILTSSYTNIGDVICEIKELHRLIPHNGLGYGVLRYLQSQTEASQALSVKGDSNNHQLGSILFNYLGQFDQVVNQDSIFGIAKEKVTNIVNPQMDRGYELGLTFMVTGGQLSLRLDYNQYQFDAKDMETFALQVKEAIEQVVEHCLSVVAGLDNNQQARFTPSDFPLAKVSQADLDKWQRDYQIADCYPATGMQQGLLFHSMMSSASYVNQTHMYLHQLDLALFRQAWLQVIERHNVFRTAFVGQQSGLVHQLVTKNAHLPFKVHDLSHIDSSLLADEVEQIRLADRQLGFVAEQSPLMRLTVIECSDERHQIIWSCHHAIVDGWSMPLIFGEVTECYRALRQNDSNRLAAPQNYRGYAKWLSEQDPIAAQVFWQSQLSHISEATPLPLVAHKGEYTGMYQHKFGLTQGQTDRLVALSKSAHTTVNVLVQAAWALLLARYSGNSTVVFGAVSSGRPAQLAGVESMVGLFINTLPVVIDLDPQVKVSDWLNQLHQQLSEREKFSYVPLSQIIKQAGISQGLFDSLVVFENFPVDEAIGEKVDEAALQLEKVQSYTGTSYSMSLIAEFGSQLNFKFDTKTPLLSMAQIEQLSGDLTQLLLSMCDHADNALVNVDIIDDATRKELVALSVSGESVAASNSQHVIASFNQFVDSAPHNIALVDKQLEAQQQFSYQQVSDLSDVLAAKLVSNGATRNTLVGIALPRGAQSIIAILAVLKAGATYVPLDISSGNNRINYILADTKLKHLICQPEQKEQWQVSADVSQYQVDDSLAKVDELPKVNNWQQCQGSDLVYVIYTSGSTGKPKGVQISHDNLNHYLASLVERHQLETELAFALMTSIATDLGNTSLFLSLTQGGCLHLFSQQQVLDSSYMSDYLQYHAIDVLKMTPSHYNALFDFDDDSKQSPVRWLFLGGEAIDASLADKLYQLADSGVQVINHYGPTEATIGCITYQLSTENKVADNSKLPIGKPLAHMRAYVVRKDGQLAPFGAKGELYVGGAGVACGYLNQPQLSEQRFISDKFDTHHQGKLYRTGDLVQYTIEGDLLYLGRSDNQVKIRGFRVELEEIELGLKQLASVVDAVVQIKDVANKANTLVAYIVAVGDIDKALIKTQLGEIVPNYMVPDVVVNMQEFPLLGNGKVDRQAMPTPSAEDFANTASTTDQAGTEIRVQDGVQSQVHSQLIELFTALLPVSTVGLDDNFFTIGGDSIICVQLVSRAKALGLYFSVKDVFESPTVAALAPLVKFTQAKVYSQAPVHGSYPLLPIQRQFIGQNRDTPNHYNQSLLLKTHRSIDQQMLSALCEAIYRRHDALRMRFNFDGSEQSRQISSEVTVTHQVLSEQMIAQSVVIEDLTALKGEQLSEKIEAICEQQQRSLDLVDGPIFKLVYIHCVKADQQQAEGRLLLLAHHMIVDGVSWRILLDDIQQAFTQLSTAKLATVEQIKLAPKSASYQLWAERLSEYPQTKAGLAEQAYWQQALNDFAIANTANNHQANSAELFADIRHDGQSRRQFVASPQLTANLLGDANQAYRTGANELILAALYLAFGRTYGASTGRHCLQINMEGHGREHFDHLSDDEQIDCSGTVGWFTSHFPLLLNLPLADLHQQSEQGLAKLIKTTKESLRSIPNHGAGFGLIQYYSQDPAVKGLIADTLDKSVVFNYLGQLDGVLSNEPDSDFSPASESRGSESTEYNLANKLIINAKVVDGQFDASLLVFSKSIENTLIEQWFSEFESALDVVVNHCLSVNQSNQLKQQFIHLTTKAQDLSSSVDLDDMTGIEI